MVQCKRKPLKFSFIFCRKQRRFDRQFLCQEYKFYELRLRRKTSSSKKVFLENQVKYLGNRFRSKKFLMHISYDSTRDGRSRGAGQGAVFGTRLAVVIFSFRDGQRPSHDGSWTRKRDEVVYYFNVDCGALFGLYISEVSDVANVVARSSVSALERILGLYFN